MDARRADTPDAELDPSLVGWWRFEEAGTLDCLDSSGHGNDGTAIGGLGRTVGIDGAAATFDGQSAYCAIGDNGSFTVRVAFTIAVWLALDDVAYNQRFASTFNTWDLKLNGRAPQLTMPTGFAVAGGMIPAGTWHHVTFTYESTAVTIYIDGVLAPLSTDTLSGAAPPVPPESGGLLIGALAPPSEFALGALDEIRIYDRALVPDEIAMLAARP